MAAKICGRSERFHAGEGQGLQFAGDEAAAQHEYPPEQIQPEPRNQRRQHDRHAAATPDARMRQHQGQQRCADRQQQPDPRLLDVDQRGQHQRQSRCAARPCGVARQVLDQVHREPHREQRGHGERRLAVGGEEKRGTKPGLSGTASSRPAAQAHQGGVPSRAATTRASSSAGGALQGDAEQRHRAVGEAARGHRGDIGGELGIVRRHRQERIVFRAQRGRKHVVVGQVGGVRQQVQPGVDLRRSQRQHDQPHRQRQQQQAPGAAQRSDALAAPRQRQAGKAGHG